MSSPLLGNIVQVFLAAGGGAMLLAIVNAVIKHFFGKNEEQINAAKIIQAMSLDMLDRLHRELETLHSELDKTRGQAQKLRDEFDQLLTWARAANREMNANGLSVGPMPFRLISGERNPQQ